jgi:prepilin-type N-terminal cleavage/methylation domain-containing protein
MKIYKIAQAASRLGISKQTLRRYEKKGILPQARRNRINSWREYTEEDVEKVRHILQHGFSLIELVMVIVLVGILAASAVPRIESFYLARLAGAAKKTISDIRYTQQIAISRHTNSRIVFNPSTEIYTAQEEYPSASGNWTAIKDPFAGANLTVNYKTDPQYSGINIASANFGNSSTLQFNWLGTPLSAGTAVFDYRGNTRTILVENSTGLVSVQ